MRLIITVSLYFFFLFGTLLAQRSEPVFQQVEISMAGKTLNDLGRVGIDVTHGHYVKGVSFTATFGDWELDKIRSAGFSIDVKIDDVQTYYLERNKKALLRNPLDSLDCQLQKLSYKTPFNFELGSMGGFFTINQMNDHIDAMAFAYPNLISTRKPISNIKTIRGNDIDYVRISDNPGIDESEPEVLYTALHHAREPISMSQMIFYMWYLLENYESDPLIRDIVNNTELYFVPCVNPDGYIQNAETHPNGGGMWRKNLRDNDGDGHYHIETDGVDINRNYGFQWGYDNDGSSPNNEAETYRGVGAFSEPETQAMRNFLSNRDFSFAFNYHSHGNVLIYPWGYDNVPNDRLQEYESYAEVLTLENDYIPGTTQSTLEYFSNGDANDWMFGDESVKPTVVTFTPEVGSMEDGFYPAIDNIIPLCRQTMGMNLMLAKLPHAFAFIREQNNTTTVVRNNKFIATLKNFGVNATSFEVELRPLSDHVQSYTNVPKNLILESLEEEELIFEYVLDNDTPDGAVIPFEVQAFNGAITETDTIFKVYAPDSRVVYEDGGSLSNWFRPGGGTWSVSSEDAYEGGTAMTDSPNSNYGKNVTNIIQLKQEIDLTDASNGYIEFWAKWTFDEFFDFVSIQVSADNGPWENLCGKLSSAGTIFQDFNQPVYNRSQADWAKEYISLASYAGLNLKVRFVLKSDGFLERDGFYFDEFIVVVNEKTNVSTKPIEKEGLMIDLVRPNPANVIAHVPITMSSTWRDADLRVNVRNALGQKMISRKLEYNDAKQLVTLDVGSFLSGTYFVTVESQQSIISTQLLIIE